MSELDDEYVIWWSQQDQRVCQVCERLHGQRFSASDAENHFPAHMNCRCELLEGTL